MSLSIPFPLWVAAEQKAASVEVNISLAFLHWVGIALHPWPFVSDIAIFVLKGDVKLQLTNDGILNLMGTAKGAWAVGSQYYAWVAGVRQSPYIAILLLAFTHEPL